MSHQEILDALNHEIRAQSNEAKKRHRVSQPVFRHSLEFAMNKSKESAPAGYGFILSADVKLSEQNEINDFDIRVRFKKT